MKKKTLLAISVMLLVLFANGFADNPIIQTRYTADPAPYVHDDGTLYLYTSHDEDADIGFFHMKDWVCYTTTDMVNWTDHGAVASLRSFPWADKAVSGWDGFDNGAWAPHAVERNGKWYLYCPIHGRGIGVLVADNPFGPFTDPLKKPLIGGGYDSIDPAVYIDGGNQAYLYWGNPRCWYVKLNEDMISYDTSVGDNGLIVLDMTVEAFGKRSRHDEKRPTSYEEGPWLYKRNHLYYLFFAGGPIPEHIGYSTGPSPEGPWTYGGVVMTPQSAFTIHPGVVDYKGKTYLFYHNGDLPGGGGFKRSVCVDELTFNPDGSVEALTMTREGAHQVGHLNPYQTVQGETLCWTGGVETEPCDEGGMNVCDIEDGDYIKIEGVDFGDGAKSFQARVASATNGGRIELRLDSLDGKLIGTCRLPGTGGWQTWSSTSCTVDGASGVHDLFLKFAGDDGYLFNINWWKFDRQ